MNRLSALLIPFALATALSLQGQEKIQQDVLVIKSYLPSVQDTRKITFLPELTDSTSVKPRFSYSIQSKRIPTSFVPEPIKPAKILPEPLPRLYGNYIRLGLGTNFTRNISSLAELSLSTLRNRDYMAGLEFSHQARRGSIRTTGSEAATYYPNWADNSGKAYYHRFYTKSDLRLHAGFSQSRRQFYGYAQPNDAIDSQRFNIASAGWNLQSRENLEQKSAWGFSGDYYYLFDAFKFNENGLSLKASFDQPYKEIYKIGLEATMDMARQNQKELSEAISTTIIDLAPFISRKYEESEAEAGIRLSPSFYSGGHGKFRLFPFARFQYRVYENYLLSYFGFDGGEKVNTVRDLVQINPYLSTDSVPGMTERIEPVTTKLRLYGGIKGNLSSAMTFDAHVSYSEKEDDPFFRPDDLSFTSLKFRIIHGKYDVLQAGFELSLKKAEGFAFDLKGRYSKYFNVEMTDSFQVFAPTDIAWNRPEVELDLACSYNLGQKIIATADLFFIGPRKGPLPYPNWPTADLIAVADYTTLPAVIDMNLGLEYRYNRKAGAFVRFDNILGQRYELFPGYPGYGFNFMAGLTYGF